MASSDQLIAEADSLLEQSSLRLKQAVFPLASPSSLQLPHLSLGLGAPLREVRTRSEVPLSAKDTLLLRCKDAIEQLNLEIQEEKRQRAAMDATVQTLEQSLEAANFAIAQLTSELERKEEEVKAAKSGAEESVRKAVKRREEEIRDACAMKEAKMKLELKNIIEQLEEELDASNIDFQATKEANALLTAEVSSLKSVIDSQIPALIEENKRLKSSVPAESNSVAQLTAKVSSEMQKRLQDKEEFKAILQKDKAAFSAKIEEKERTIQSLRSELASKRDFDSSQQVLRLTSQVKEERLKRLQAERELLTLRRSLLEQRAS